MTTPSPSAFSDWQFSLFRVAAFFLLVAWGFQIAAAVGGNTHWWNWTNLSGGSLMLGSVAVRLTRKEWGNALLYGSAFLSVASVAGMIVGALQGSH